LETLLDKRLHELEIIKKEMEPCILSLEEQEVELFSLAMFLSSFLKELLKDIETKQQREVIVKNILDEDYDKKI
jgi:hypothetical protein